MGSRYFAWLDDQPETPYDFQFRKGNHPDLVEYHFSLGGVAICRMTKMTWRKPTQWSCSVCGELPKHIPRSVGGFINRHACIDYALSVHERTHKTYNHRIYSYGHQNPDKP